MKKNIVLIVLILVAAFMLDYYCRSHKELVYKTIYKEKIVYKTALASITKEDLQKDLSNASLSQKNQGLVLTSIYKVSAKYGIPEVVLYSLIYSESSFRFWIKHNLVTVVNSKGKKVKTRGIGLGGIIYEIWGAELVKNNIIVTKSDLYQIESNIEAIGYILNKEIKKPLLKGTKSQVISGLRRYFGGNYKSYSYKIKLKIAGLLYRKIL